MATSYATDPRPEFTSELKGNKVILSRKVEGAEPKSKSKDETPAPPDADTTPEPPADKPKRDRGQGSTA